jgi:phosphate transport system permease protein
MVWLTGGSLALCLAMILGLLALVLVKGFGTFWPSEVVRVRTADGRTLMGEVAAEEEYTPSKEALEPATDAGRAAVLAADGKARRRMLRTANFDLTGSHYTWVSDFEITEEDRPDWVVVVERMEWGRFYGTPIAFLLDGAEATTDPAEAFALFERHHGEVRERRERRKAIETHDQGRVNHRVEAARLAVRRAELDHGAASDEVRRARETAERVRREGDAESAVLQAKIEELNRENARYQLRLETADGKTKDLPLASIVRAYPANRLSVGERLGVYGERWGEFLTAEPRESNSEGGVWPAIFGTVAMTLIMSLLVVPFGVMAALYLREYAKPGPVVSVVRVAINNLAGVPSIVFGVFGLGFLCYVVGGGIDEWLFAEKLPNPTYKKGGLLWASLTLALLTLPVVIVATEEALSAVPRSMREGSFACGASKWQTIRRIVLPRAMPGILTGMILAIARGAGEVAPLMLVGAVKQAPELPVDGSFPFVHPERSFMHLGFHIYDVGFQSPNSEAAKPMVYTTTLLLILLIVVLNLVAISVRARLRRKFLVGSA